MTSLARWWLLAQAASVSALVPRAVVLVLGVAGFLLAAPPALIAFLSVVGVVTSLVVPERVAAGPAVAMLALGWITRYGVDGAPGPARTVGLAVVLVLLTSAGALASAVPLSARVDSAVYRRWARALIVPVAVAVVLGAVAGLLGTVPGSDALDVIGLLGGLAAIVLLGRFLRRG